MTSGQMTHRPIWRIVGNPDITTRPGSTRDSESSVWPITRVIPIRVLVSAVGIAANVLFRGWSAEGRLWRMTPSDCGVDRPCLRNAIPEIETAAQYLQDAVSAHLAGESDIAEELIRQADMPTIREWVESIWGKASPYRQFRQIADAPLVLGELRMPSSAQKLFLLNRDCYRCRFCGIPVVRLEVRRKLHSLYPRALPWGRSNVTQHAAFQAIWAQFDHLLPHSRGGGNGSENIVVACAPCNFGRMQNTLAELGLCDPRAREPIQSKWDGLERLIHCF
jgi:hypothetical protein